MSLFHTPEQCVFRTQMRFAHCETVVPLGAVFVVSCHSDAQNFTVSIKTTGVLLPCVCSLQYNRQATLQDANNRHSFKKL